MSLHFGFAWPGLVVFALPMLINIAYALLPPIGGRPAENGRYPIVEGIEQASRLLYLLTLCLFVGNSPMVVLSPLFVAAAVFLVLYYACWIRYFICGRAVELLGKAFLFVPQPLAVFPVLYFVFAALWMHNLVAAGVMVAFGIAHNIVTYRNLHNKEI